MVGFRLMASKRIGLIVGGGPAPGINGVISAVTLEALSHQGWDVLGFREGFRWLVRGDTEHIWHLTANDVRNINLKGGSILGTARVNPTKSEADMARVVDTLKRLNIDLCNHKNLPTFFAFVGLRNLHDFCSSRAW